MEADKICTRKIEAKVCQSKYYLEKLSEYYWHSQDIWKTDEELARAIVLEYVQVLHIILRIPERPFR